MACGAANYWATSATAFAVVVTDCATVPRWTFAHELGHLYGAAHDRPQGGSSVPYGYGLIAPNYDWKTLMVRWTEPAFLCEEGNPCTPRVLYWSNPNVTWPYSAQLMGTTAYEDNARLLNERKAALSLFRHPSVSVSGPSPITRAQQPQYTAGTTGGASPWTYRWNRRTG